MIDITVAFPVGYKPEYKLYLPECLESIRQQTKKPYELIIVDDAAHLDRDDSMFDVGAEHGTMIYKFPWYFGLCAGTNTCMSLARTQWVYIMSCDDKFLVDDALEQTETEILKHKQELAWYFPYMIYDKPILKDTELGYLVKWPTMVGVMPREHFLRSGGLHPVSEFTAPDHVLKTLFETKLAPYKYYPIGNPEQPTYYARFHKASHTETAGKWGPYLDMTHIAEKVVQFWEPPQWTEGFR